jgi:hypothetical protein
MNPSLPVSAEARGLIRQFKRELAEEDHLWEAIWTSKATFEQAERWTCSGRVGRDRARLQLERRFGRALPLPHNHLVWSHLRPRAAVIQHHEDRDRLPGEAQDAVVVDFLLAGGADVLQAGLWTLEVPDHALHRLVQRCPGIDLRLALLEAHYNFLLAGPEVLQPNVQHRLPAGPGVFLGDVIYGKEMGNHAYQVIYFRPRTAFHRDMLDAEDLNRLVTCGEDRSVISGPLLPGPLRDLDTSGGRLNVRLTRPSKPPSRHQRPRVTVGR